MTAYSKALHAAGSELERTLEFHLRAECIDYEREYRFAGSDNWRFDFALVALKIAVEVEGGTKCYGRHNRPAGFEADCSKYNAAVILGWHVLRFTSDMVNDGRAILVIKRAIKALSEAAE